MIPIPSKEEINIITQQIKLQRMEYDKYLVELAEANKELKDALDDNIGPAIVLYVNKEGVQIIQSNFAVRTWPKYVQNSLFKLANNYSKFLSKLTILRKKLDEAD